MKAVMLAAGVGNRLFGDDGTQLPKSLLRFEGKTLLQRHLENLLDLGVEELELVCGFRMDEIVREAANWSPPGFIHPVQNKNYRKGSVISLSTACSALRSGESILLMDADVLYDPAILHRLIGSESENCLLLDKACEDDDESVKICIRDGEIIEFGKIVEGHFDLVGEWPGFLRMSPLIAAQLADASEVYVTEGKLDATCEFAIRDVLLSAPSGIFRFEDISDLSWIEIDFPSDLEYAKNIVLPRINAGRTENDV
jgi:choline kinase